MTVIKQEEDATSGCKWRLTKHGFGKSQGVKYPVQRLSASILPGGYMSITHTIITDIINIIR